MESILKQYEYDQSILIIDDSVVNIQLLTSLLDQNAEIFFATTGSEGILTAVKNQPDLILLDVMMEDMDGYDVCRQLKSQLSTESIPVLMITCRTEQKDEERGLELGAIDYITKPFSPIVVQSKVKNHLDLQAYKKQLEYMAKVDALTCLANRHYFEERFNNEWQRAVRSGSSLACLMVDVNDFKSFNDNYGHIIGDTCLQKVAKAIKSGIKRSCDLVARYGGDEFVCILTETDFEGAEKVAQRIQQNVFKLKISHEFAKFGNQVSITVGSAACMPSSKRQPHSLLSEADDELCRIKRDKNKMH